MPAPIVVREPRLVPVVQLEPSLFQRTPVEHRPLGPGPAERAEAEARYWRESLATSALGHLEPVEHGSWLVPIERLVQARDLTTILLALQLPDDAPIELDQVLALPGGHVLCDGDRPVLRPGCCVGLEGLAEWKRAVEEPRPGWEELWIGHPWAGARRDGAWLWIREDEERKPPDPRTLRVDVPALDAAIAMAEAEQRRLATRLGPAVEAWRARPPGFTVDGAVLARVLAGVSSPA